MDTGRGMAAIIDALSIAYMHAGTGTGMGKGGSAPLT